jgi:hypothetical protein
MAMTTRKGTMVSLEIINERLGHMQLMIDQRLGNMQEAQAERHITINRRIDDVQKKLEAGVISRKEFDEFKLEIKSEMVTQTEFGPVKRISFGLVGIIVTAVVGAMLMLVIVKVPVL